MTTSRSHPFFQLVLARLREFIREPEVIFWVYGFPLLMILALGIAFKEKPVEEYHVDIENGPLADWVEKSLAAHGTRFKVFRADLETCKKRLRTTDTSIIVRAGENLDSPFSYLYDPLQPQSELTRSAVDDILQRAAGRKDSLSTSNVVFSEPGGRYIDFLVPGLLGMGIMGGGLWGVGFVIVDMRIRKLLKRFLATPMRRPDFLFAIMTSRFLFMIPEIVLLLIFAYFVFGVIIHGSLWLVLLLIIVGGFTFSGLGLLIACRAKTLEAISGLMNLVMLPMWVLSGIFFNSSRFPEVIQPFIKGLPLTMLNDALRNVMNKGAGFIEIQWELLGLLTWGFLTFFVGLKFFKWQ